MIRRTAARLAGRTSRAVGAVHRRVTAVIIATSLACLGVVVLAVETIGPLPRFRADVLWVHGHRASVRLGVMAVLVAAGCLAVSLAIRGGRLTVLLACVGIAAVLVLRHPESVRVVLAVLWARRGG